MILIKGHEVINLKKILKDTMITHLLIQKIILCKLQCRYLKFEILKIPHFLRVKILIISIYFARIKNIMQFSIILGILVTFWSKW